MNFWKKLWIGYLQLTKEIKHYCLQKVVESENLFSLSDLVAEEVKSESRFTSHTFSINIKCVERWVLYLAC